MVKKSINTRPHNAFPLNITLKELAAVYAAEQRPHIRKRLRVIRFMLLGKRPEEAAKLVKAGASSAYRWIKVVREKGLDALGRDPRGQKSKPLPSAAKAARMRESIRAALKQHDDTTTQMRLLAVDSVLAGNTPNDAAREFGRALYTVKHWLAEFERGGVAALLGRPRQKASQKTVTVPGFQKLRALAAGAKGTRLGRRLRAIALLAAEGGSAELSRMWQEIAPALKLKPARHARHGRNAKLNDVQLKALRALIISRPGISRRELCAFLEKRFHVSYSEHWVGQLVSRQLGFERVDGRFRPMPRP